MRHVIWIAGFAVGLSACGDPLRDVTRLRDVPVSGASASVAETPSEARQKGGGLFGQLLNRTAQDPTNAAIAAALDVTQSREDDSAVAVATETAAAPAPASAPARPGLFGLFGANRSNNPAEPAAAQVVTTGFDAADIVTGDVQVVPAGAVVQAAPAPQAARRGLGGLFGRAASANGPRAGADGRDVDFGTALPFGEIARVCNVPRGGLIHEIENVAGLRIYDTIPNTTAQRPFYITGFKDNCARTFTGAVVIPGDVQSHEYVRYQPSNAQIGYTGVDNAYEALKANVCRVGRGQPCGARTGQLNRNTQFITVYGFFAGSLDAVPTQWVQILVHDGRVLAIDIKDG